MGYMKKALQLFAFLFLITSSLAVAQSQEEIVSQIVTEANENSQLEELAHHLLDVIGPRLVGTPQQQHAHEWAVELFESWGIDARNEQYGTWRGWERGITHVDMIEPRVVTLEAMQLAWSPSTPEGGIEAEVVTLPWVENADEFEEWLSTIDGKFVLISMPQPTGRPDYNWEEWATEESFEKMRRDREDQMQTWRENIEKTGYNQRSLPAALEGAGAAGLLMSNWSRGFGTNKIFGAATDNIPHIDVLLEDYGMLWRLAENGSNPVIRVNAQSKDMGEVPTFNTIAEIRGTEKPDEYIILSAHYDSWDGGTGATDNGTGSITMMEVARILKKVYPNPKRTILVGLWGGEEQGLNGSSAFVADNPEIVDGLQALFNQDNGTGRVANISGQGFLHSYEYLTRWLSAVPRDVTQHIETSFPGLPSGGGSDHSSFVSAGAPGFMTSSLSWDYYSYTWHTNRDTYDKIVFDDVKNNVVLIATMAYMASEDPETTSRERRVLPINPRTGEQMTWPNPRTPNRQGGLD